MQPRELAISYRKVEALVPYARNAKTHPEGQVQRLAALIREYGFTNPILVDEAGGIVAGHGRLQAARLVGMEDVPVIVLQGLTEAQRRALVIADNKVAEKGGWDTDLLKLEVEELKLQGFNLELTGLDARELKGLLSPKGGRTDEDDIPDPLPATVTKTGDLWCLDEHRILCGDSFNRDDVDALVHESGLVNMVLTDPPFAIYGSSSGISSDIADDKMVRPFFEKLGAVLMERVVEFGHIYVHCDWRSYATLWHGLKSARLTPKNCIVWDKGHFGLGGMYGNAHEFVAFFARLPPQKAMTSGNKRGQRPVLGCANVFKAARVRGEERQHNAAKPVELLSWLINNSSDPGHTVLDLFAGSGSTIIACQKTERRCYAMEMEPRHVDICVKRWEQFTGKQATLGGDGRSFVSISAERIPPTHEKA